MVLEWGNLASNDLENVAVGAFFCQGASEKGVALHNGPVKGGIYAPFGLGMVKICWIMVHWVVSGVRLLYTGGSQFLLIYEE